MNFVAEELAGVAAPDSLVEVMSNLPGETFREVESRRTFRFFHNGSAYFAKVHFGVGWAEVVKNLVQLRLPVLDASNEFRAIRKLEALDIPSMEIVAYAVEGLNPASRRSCIVTAALQNTISLEDLFLEGNVSPVLKRRLIDEVARIARLMHANGLNHRDFYICHFHLDRESESSEKPRLHVIDLHRAQLRPRTPTRWVVKDVAGLLFSVLDADFTRRDLYRFMRRYAGSSLRDTLLRDNRFWHAVVGRARRLYAQENGRFPTRVERLLG